MIRYPFLLVLACLLLSGNPAIAAEGNAADKQNAEREADEKSGKQEGKQTDAAKKNKNKSKDKEIFIPSEEISEDFAVSFPVDI